MSPANPDSAVLILWPRRPPRSWFSRAPSASLVLHLGAASAKADEGLPGLLLFPWAPSGGLIRRALASLLLGPWS